MDMRLPLIVANWKMNHTGPEAVSFIQHFVKKKITQKIEVVICPPFTVLETLSRLLFPSPYPPPSRGVGRPRRGEGEGGLQLGAQNCHWEPKGAYTGEVSPAFLKSLNCHCVIVGHSERRQLFGETDEMIRKKVLSVLRFEMAPILCIGETKREREQNQTERIIQDQLVKDLERVDEASLQRVVIAYEPVWAIGTGLSASQEQAQAVHLFIRSWVAKNKGEKAAKGLRILYGGSVTPDNIGPLMDQPDIDGALVGGASLSVDSFLQIVHHAEGTKENR